MYWQLFVFHSTCANAQDTRASLCIRPTRFVYKTLAIKMIWSYSLIHLVDRKSHTALRPTDNDLAIKPFNWFSHWILIIFDTVGLWDLTMSLLMEIWLLHSNTLVMIMSAMHFANTTDWRRYISNHIVTHLTTWKISSSNSCKMRSRILKHQQWPSLNLRMGKYGWKVTLLNCEYLSSILSSFGCKTIDYSLHWYEHSDLIHWWTLVAVVDVFHWCLGCYMGSDP